MYFQITRRCILPPIQQPYATYFSGELDLVQTCRHSGPAQSNVDDRIMARSFRPFFLVHDIPVMYSTSGSAACGAGCHESLSRMLRLARRLRDLIICMRISKTELFFFGSARNKNSKYERENKCCQMLQRMDTFGRAFF